MKTKHKNKKVLIFGEDSNDSQAIKEIALGLCPELPDMCVMPKPIVLRRPASNLKINTVVARICGLVSAARVRADVVAVIIHRDLDSVEPRHDVFERSTAEDTIAADYKALTANQTSLIIALPAWEIEAWWLMWPDQVKKYRPSWPPLKRRNNQRVDLIENAKELLRRETTSKNLNRVPPYTERDSPNIARAISQDGALRCPSGKSVAYECFVKKVDELTESLMN